MSYHIDIQHATDEPIPVTDEQLNQWIKLTLATYQDSAELTIRFVDTEEITHLNHTYRQKNKATNVLAFPVNLPANIELEYPLLGDVIICPAVLKEESQASGTPLTAHYAHIAIHGVLHLLGYDHIEEDDANVMQALETRLLARLGFDDPYQYQIEESEIE